MSRKPTGRPRGRQLGSGELGLGTQDEHTRLTLRIPSDLYTRLEAFAAGRHFHRGNPPLARYVREAIEHFLICPNKRQTSNILPLLTYENGQTLNSAPEAEDNKRQTSNVPVLDDHPYDHEPLDPDSLEHWRWRVLSELRIHSGEAFTAAPLGKAVDLSTKATAAALRYWCEQGRVHHTPGGYMYGAQ